MYRLNVIGCGKVGRTLARLLNDAGLVTTLSMVSGSPQSARSAREFIGAGDLKNDISELPSADFWMVAVGDARLSVICRELIDSSRVERESVVFHCSGAVSSSLLAPLREKGAFVGSVHPIRSFADPEIARSSFAGTYCALEGEPRAVERLRPLFESLRARTFELSSESKTRCHAGHVIVSNYLVALLDIGRRVYQTAGVPSAFIDDVMLSLAQGSLANVESLGTTEALTGPIVRGEIDTVRAQLDNLREGVSREDVNVSASVYALLGRVALEIAERKDTLSAEEVAHLRALLKER
jgi:predicted short-subunit dehydrogenase-like oxidoreductase (DUF2520 family)